MKIAVEGCAHGELDNIYKAIKELEEREKVKVDLLICCGDFQSSRNVDDLACMAVPPKYRHICSFYKYFSGEAKAPILTIFIGGNHEASNYLQELPYGGWVAPNIYYLGYAGVINIAGVRIGGISGIYKSQDYMKGRYEKSPYDENSKRSVYHIRNLEVFRLKQLSEPMDIFLSHDWPSGVYHHGNVRQLLKKKPFFKDEIETNQLGSKPGEQLLNHLKPKHWFSAHLHCKFTAEVPHEEHSPTKFLALDKCLPRRQFLQIVDVPHSADQNIEIEYDLEWLTVLHLTNHLLSVRKTTTYMPGPGGNERYNFTPTENEKNLVLSKLCNNLKVPLNFKLTAAPYKAGSPFRRNNKQPEPKLNPQTVEFCEILGVDDPISLISESNGLNISLDTSFLEEDTTFINSSDSEDSDSNNDSKTTDLDIVEQESKMQDMQLPSDSKKVTPMKLPEPKLMSSQSENNSQQQNTELDSAESSSNSESSTPSSDVNSTQKNVEETVSTSPELPKTSPKRTFSEDNSEASASSPINLPEVNNCDTPTPKKFKRRNASIYGVESCTSTTTS